VFARLKALQLRLRLHCLQLLTKVIFYLNPNVQRCQVQRVIISFSDRVIRLNTAAIGSEQAKDRSLCGWFEIAQDFVSKSDTSVPTCR